MHILSKFTIPKIQIMNKQRLTYSIRNRIFYFLRPIIPRKMQIYLRRQLARHILNKSRHIWPIDPAAGQKPNWWRGWPNGKRFALVLAHDVDTIRGIRRVQALASMEKELGFVSTFNIVPERYPIPSGTIQLIQDMGFGVGVHGLNHDGKLFESKEIFQQRAKRINEYMEKWGTRGFSTPSMLHNLKWMHELDIDYSTATFDTDPFEPQPDGAATIFPYIVKNGDANKGFVEMPYTMAQDFTLFIILQENEPKIWEEKIEWIAKMGGLALVNTHSDYMAFNESNGVEEYPVARYLDFLCYIRDKYKGQYWHGLTKDAAKYCIDMYKSNHENGIAEGSSENMRAYKNI